MDDDALARAEAHVTRFNAAVSSGDWVCFVEWFDNDAEMTFPELGLPPAIGRAAILSAYRAQPPDDTMSVVSAIERDGADEVRFAWTHGGTGTMRINWSQERVAALEVRFDQSS